MSVNGFTFGTDPTIQKYNYESLDNIPDIENGTYPNMAVGSLLGTNKVTDKDPYFLRPSASIGDREFDTLVGGSLGWNQLAKRDNSTSGGATINSSTDSSINATFTHASGSWGVAFFTASNIPFIVGHKYLLLADLQLASAFTGNFYVVLGGTELQADHFFRADTSKTTVQKADTVVNCVTAMETAMIFAQTNVTGITFDLSNVMAIDLTTLFGSTIADYIYSLETAHAGDGVAWVRKYLPETYYAYCAPTLKHVEGVSAHVLTGFNQWDEEWELGLIDKNTGGNDDTSLNIRSKNFIPVIPSTNYYYLFRDRPFYVAVVVYYDKDKKYIGFPGDQGYCGNVVLKTPDNCHYVRFYCGQSFGTTYNHDICINLSDPTRNGEYEPYVKHTYPLDSTWVGMGIPKLDSSNKLYFDGDTYASDGTVTRRYGVVDLGTLNYIKNTASGYSYYSTSETAISDRKAGNSMMICAKYVVVAPDRDALAGADKTLASYNRGNSKAIAIRDDSISDATTFKTAMSGVYLVYEKATPTTSTASPYTSPQICDKDGTEEYVTTGLVPVGHETEYVENLADKLTDIPDLPTTAGTYRLNVTVSGGVPSYSWVAS